MLNRLNQTVLCQKEDFQEKMRSRLKFGDKRV